MSSLVMPILIMVLKLVKSKKNSDLETMVNKAVTELNDFELLVSCTNWSRFDEWVRKLTDLTPQYVYIIYNGHLSKCWYFPKKGRFFWTNDASGPGIMCERVKWVKNA